MILWGALGIALNVGIARFTYGVMLPSLRNDLGLDYLASGSLNSIHLAGYLIGTLMGPWLVRRMAVWRMSRHAHLLVAVGAVVCALAPPNMMGFVVLAAGRLATGIGAGVGIMATFVIVFDAVGASRRPLMSAMVWSGMNVAIVASGLCVAPLVETSAGWRVSFWIAAAIALAVAIAFPPAHLRVEKSAGQVAASLEPEASRMFSRRWIFLALAYFCFGMAYVAYATFAGVRLTVIEASMFVVGATWTALGVMSMAGSFATIPLLNAPRVKYWALSVALGCGALGAFVAAGNSPQANFVGALFVGLGLAAVPTIVSAYARDRTSTETYPKAFSAVSAFLSVGSLAGPIAGGAIGDWIGSAWIPLFAAAVYGAGALFAAIDAAIVRREAQQ
ncbi:MAG TPA: YbfB/YjiJ family MFS transporter [Xanthobacteraceae bacterium]|nr:YbfB/YjiJ family MFS transporter [Xanthobacteraceae bacterium]